MWKEEPVLTESLVRRCQRSCRVCCAGINIWMNALRRSRRHPGPCLRTNYFASTSVYNVLQMNILERCLLVICSDLRQQHLDLTRTKSSIASDANLPVAKTFYWVTGAMVTCSHSSLCYTKTDRCTLARFRHYTTTVPFLESICSRSSGGHRSQCGWCQFQFRRDPGSSSSPSPCSSFKNLLA